MKANWTQSLAMTALSFIAPLSIASEGYWQTGSGSPLLDSSGNCVKASLANQAELNSQCERSDRVILLPGANGKTGAIVVTARGQTARIEKAYGTLSASSNKLSPQTKMTAHQVETKFAQLLDSQPRGVKSYTVRFISGSATELTQDSLVTITQLKQEITRRTAPEVRLVGHTDSVGDLESNDLLSLQRAQTVSNILITNGLNPKLLEATGRGEREQAVKTADNVSEVANRRVDIKVR